MSSSNLNMSMNRVAERGADEGTIEDFNNADLNDNGQIDRIQPDSFVSVPLAVGLKSLNHFPPSTQ